MLYRPGTGAKWFLLLAIIAAVTVVGFFDHRSPFLQPARSVPKTNVVSGNTKSTTKTSPVLCNGTNTLTNVVDDGTVWNYSRMSELLEGPGAIRFEGNDNTTTDTNRTSLNTNSATAVCCFQEKPNSNHFPHAMEQLYRCWSFWRWANPSHRLPILVGPDQKFVSYFNPSQQKISTRYWKRKGPGDFAKSMIRAWQETIGLLVVAPDHPLADNSSMVWAKQDSYYTPYMFTSPDDARALADLILSNLKFSFLKPSLFRKRLKPKHTFPSTQQRAGCRSGRGDSHPRITILNREMKSKRSILNTLAIITDLEQTLDQTVDVAYFEGRNFLEQISLFASNDIVLTVHGAQMTSLPFMPSCGAILEVFGHGYYVPWYYKSLALASGIRHYSAYVGTDLEKAFAVMSNFTTRVFARSKNVCPKVDDVVHVAQRMVQDWRECCATR